MMKNILYRIPYSTSFIFYHLPYIEKVHFISQHTPIQALISFQDFHSKQGYIFYPFHPNNDISPYFISADEHLTIPVEGLSSFDIVPNLLKGSARDYSTKQKEYCNQVQLAVNSIQNGKFEKVVLSRILKVDSIPINPMKIFAEMLKQYPSAFVSLVSIPGVGVWVMATPEILVSCEDDKIKTVALAGTKGMSEERQKPQKVQRKENAEDIQKEWDEKEIKEQRIVTYYIEEILLSHCVKINISIPETITAGNVKHIKTTLTARLKSDLWDLVNNLHPTPAVGGYPKEKAIEFILKTEAHNRKYYTGYSGPCNIEGRTDLFVNIRCAELFRTSAIIYTGAGITIDSSPEKEWQETQRKAETMLNILKPHTIK